MSIRQRHQNAFEGNLNGYGHFSEEPASFVIDSPDLPVGWDYVYQNRKMLLRVDQHGPIYAQADPPNDIMLFRREGFQRDSSWLVWLRSDDFKCGAFSNFLRPNMSNLELGIKPDIFRVTYAPSSVLYEVELEGVSVCTRFFLPPDCCAVCMNVTVRNLRRKSVSLSVIPVLRPYVNPAQLAPWDKAEWYLKTAFLNRTNPGFATQLMNMNAEPQKRRTVVLWSSTENFNSAEISHEKFVGQGDFKNPEAVFGKNLRLKLSDGRAWGEFAEQNTLYGYPPVNALQYAISLRPNQSWTLRQVIGIIPQGDGGALPSVSAAEKLSVFLKQKPCEDAVQKTARRYGNLMKVRSIDTPDAALNRYVNEWLPVQMDWVAALDRGWPSGMRGSRDSANDFTAMVPLDPCWSQDIINTLMSCQRSDGWFPRQYSSAGRLGKHDLRGHVDAGVWVIELLYNYLCGTRDFKLLDETITWLDKDEKSSVWEHTTRAMDYFICDENIGEHGLCKVREGEWLDSVNRAGLEGRGEGVMISGQVIIALSQMCEIVRHLFKSGKMSKSKSSNLLKLYSGKCESLRSSLRKNAYNKDGYFNGFFNDDGKWIFSEMDPDGERRVYGPANWFAIASGVAMPDLTDSILKEMEFLRCPGGGFRLLYPPMGANPIECVGRGGTGDQPAGLWENGTVYNQGSHGFLIRALATAGRGDMLYEVLRCLLPYDQEIHPVSATLTPPYAVVNCYLEVPGFMYRGGLLFLTGSIAYGLRAAYEWMFGIRPQLDGLVIDPCVPTSFRKIEAHFQHLGKKVRLVIKNPDASQCGVRKMRVNGIEVTCKRHDPFSGREQFLADDRMFKNKVNVIEVIM